ncbi:MAG: exodeoxyribonuclease III [Limosilactobacillus coleohominis]|uniref:exodeoxyribonuclease III n=1 Tax=Limosilactobacillus coleohominis TaxID=181675 RepID=UPI002A827588|nr:exodeoxyribonuclease III [Limosilactobacillus coleohominis]MCI5812871.1 exodeoxyribonuclease III [Lactobacillus sp.]MDY3702334.1 exodeoxyribonuclease III [Limosilactobacillus coleohominis]MDY5628356.1 exodeoxyribonuclease III [Limosilactobacillus coleohominis]
MKFISWNIDSINAALTGTSKRAGETREVLHKIAGLSPDIVAIQETKLSKNGPTNKHLSVLDEIFPSYQVVWRSSVEPARKGYAGTMYLYRDGLTPQVTYPKIDAPAPMDDEGRMITLEFPDFYVTEVYTPNSGSGLKRLDERQVWDDRYREYLQSLDQKKPVIASGDFNVAHEPIDLAHPENNHHSAGFTDEEREHFTKLLKAGFTDSFRHLHPEEKGVYSWWAQRVITSKQNNSGWRIDYWLVSDRIAEQIQNSSMIDTGERRDHTPIELDIDL